MGADQQETIARSVQHLLSIKAVLNMVMNDPGTGVQIRLVELYEHVQRISSLQDAFPTARSFSQFLRAQHQTGILKQVITNYTVDTAIPTHYEWYFHRLVEANGGGATAEVLASTNRNRNHKKNILTATGERVRSHQERFIHDALSNVPHFTVRYEFPLHAFGGNKDVDFHVINNRSRQQYYWEHFGMTNSEYYKDGMVRKLEWYRSVDLKPLEEGGNLIFTYFTNENAFHRSVQAYIKAIR